MVNPDQLKKLLQEWCSEDNIPIKEFNLKPDEKTLIWSFQIDKLIVYCQTRFPDRIFYQADITFALEQVEMVSKWDNTKKTSLVANLSRNAIEFDYNSEFLFDDKKNIKGIRIHKFTVSELTKSDFIQMLVRVQALVGYNFNLLNMSMGIESINAKQQAETSSDNPLSN
jgi:hypothetical protein